MKSPMEVYLWKKTVPELKASLRIHNIVPGTERKAELIQLLLQTIAKGMEEFGRQSEVQVPATATATTVTTASATASPIGSPPHGTALERRQQYNTMWNDNMGGHGEGSGVGVGPKPMNNSIMVIRKKNSTNVLNNNSMNGTNTMNNRTNATLRYSSPIHNNGANFFRGKILSRVEKQHDDNCTVEGCYRCKSVLYETTWMGRSSGSGRGSGNSRYHGSWQTMSDIPNRNEMLHRIANMFIMILKEKNVRSPWDHSETVRMAKEAERRLYRKASSLHAYVDIDTLKQRLLQLSKEVHDRRPRKNANNNSVADSSMGVHDPPISRRMDDNKLSRKGGYGNGHPHRGSGNHCDQEGTVKTVIEMLEFIGGGGGGGSGGDQPYDQPYGGGNYGPDSGEHPPYSSGGQVSGGYPQVHHPQPQPHPYGYQADENYQPQQQHGQRSYNPDAHPQIVVEWNIPGVTLDKLRDKIQQIIEGGDKKTVTVTSVRATLEEWLDMDLKKYKDTIRTLAVEFL